MAKSVKLELDSLTIHRPKKRWNIYFILATEHPTEPEKMVLAVVPEHIIRVRPAANNLIDFVPNGNGGDGLIVLERDLPEDHTLRVRLYLRHSHQPTRSLGDVLDEIQNEFGDEVIETVIGLFGGTTPWIVISKAAFSLLITILRNVKDKDMGFLSLDEHFTKEFQEGGEQDRSAPFSTGDATLVWTWSLEG